MDSCPLSLSLSCRRRTRNCRDMMGLRPRPRPSARGGVGGGGVGHAPFGHFSPLRPRYSLPFEQIQHVLNLTITNDTLSLAAPYSLVNYLKTPELSSLIKTLVHVYMVCKCFMCSCIAILWGTFGDGCIPKAVLFQI